MADLGRYDNEEVRESLRERTDTADYNDQRDRATRAIDDLRSHRNDLEPKGSSL